MRSFSFQTLLLGAWESQEFGMRAEREACQVQQAQDNADSEGDGEHGYTDVAEALAEAWA